jgi:hypothetical protein
VVDEPLYAYYLKASDADHPGRAEVLANLETDSDKVIQDTILGPCDRPVLFMKQMAHHLVNVDRTFLSKTSNVFLIRDPKEVLRSLSRQIPQPNLRDTGLQVQVELLDFLEEIDQKPPVLDSRELLLDPEVVLRRLCQELEIPFDISMLAWSAGPRPEDGIWARHWYENVHRSTGFNPYTPKSSSFPESLEPLLEECRPYYEVLYSKSIKASGQAQERS